MSDYKLTKPSPDDDGVISSRRRFLKQFACGSLLAMSGGSNFASAAVQHVYGRSSHKALALQNPNTGDALKLTYFEKGRYIKGALREINYLLRDFHTDTVHPIDPALLDQLYDLKQTLGINKPFHIISGYRSPYTNANLRKHSHGVAKHSLHMEGRAIDIRIEGVSTRHIRNAAVAMGRGGVGYYPHSNFVHMDTGDVRIW
ncbi:MAG: YcbK family protein [Methylococcaceae bacterium]